ncbi:MAG TPA: ATP-binding protein [Verrucomicrobiae bacterium]|nr:ATP-binding protein [Verrucomicrobiae bacterium]
MKSQTPVEGCRRAARERMPAGLAVWLALMLGLAAVHGQDHGLTNVPATLMSSETFSNTLGSWIWADTRADGQVCRFWRTFTVPEGTRVRKARLRMTADNEFILSLDGREMGRGAEWREIYDFDLTPLISPGRHVLAVRARNSFSFAGMIFGLRVDLADGRVIEVKSDPTWRIVPDDSRHWETAISALPDWPAARVVAAFGGDPWSQMPVNVNVMPVLQPIHLSFWQTGWFQVTLLAVCGLVMLLSLWLMTQLALHKQEQLLLRRERARIARDIHDDLGSRMTQLVLHGEVALSELTPETAAGGQLERICQDARGVLSTLDEILWAVNPRRDTLNDFTAYVCSYAEEFLRPTAIQCRFDVDSETTSVVLDLPVRRALLMAIKETLNNAVKHSGATELQLQIQRRGRKLAVVVTDNGQGFDPTAVTARRNGLTNMAQRLRELGGTCVVTSRPGQGCRVEFALALKPSRWRPFTNWWPAKSPAITRSSAHETTQTNESAGH